jgi:hypothetical protein
MFLGEEVACREADAARLAPAGGKIKLLWDVSLEASWM